MNANPKLTPLRDPDYLRSFQHRECLARGHGECSGDVVGHHLLLGWMGKSIKPPDNAAVPLCHRHHMVLHTIGENRFWIELFNESRQALTEVLRGYAERMHELATD